MTRRINEPSGSIIGHKADAITVCGADGDWTRLTTVNNIPDATCSPNTVFPRTALITSELPCIGVIIHTAVDASGVIGISLGIKDEELASGVGGAYDKVAGLVV